MDTSTTPLPLGKLPFELLSRLLASTPHNDPAVLVWPGIGVDCAVIDPTGTGPLLVCKSDPITFATDEIGWYLVQVNANDIATTGAEPRWLMVTMLLPEGQTTPESTFRIFDQVQAACRDLGISVVGGHTEITYGLNRALAAGTLMGLVERGQLVTPRGARPGDKLLLTKGVPIEATSLLAREFPDRLSSVLSPAELAQAQRFLYEPGISVVRDARIALAAARAAGGAVTAMHDPTEGGLLGALWELAEASACTLVVDPASVPVPGLAGRICAALKIDPLASIASGALLMSVSASCVLPVRRALEAEGIACAEIGAVEAAPPGAAFNVQFPSRLAPRPTRDAITALFE